jgi:SAM-dependent methyltransferase
VRSSRFEIESPRTNIVLTATDRANAEFWDELCGSTMARALGITDRSLESLQRFDRAYLGFYPYLLDRVGLDQMRGKNVLEVGLGYGTLSQQIAMVAAAYTGLDVAAGPVSMVNHRLQMQGLPGRAVQGSMLDAPFAAEEFDVVVSIGCFHHTGDVPRCIDETYRILKPGGDARIMVYNRNSYRQWLLWPREALVAALARRGSPAKGGLAQRKAYDVNAGGEAAPETVFLSSGELAQMFRRYSHFACHKENCGDLPFRLHRLLPRRVLLPVVGPLAGLDLYVEARK